jgi:acetyltransferase-like isoleucine patch superfamily enzyme
VTAQVTVLTDWSDDRGNRIEHAGSIDTDVRVEFTGSNNRLVVHAPVRLSSLSVHFNCDNGYVELGPSEGVPAFGANIRVGQDARVVVGRNVSSTSRVGMSAVEGAEITIGDDVMFASDNQLRCDDGHPIFDVRTGKRVNPSRSIAIGDHVWLGWGAVLLGGTTLGEGSVVGIRSVVKGAFPNNCVIAGVPARVLRKDVAWERPHLSLVKPFYKPDASTVKKSPYWHLTREDGRRRGRGWRRSGN